jgi:hypothetical protein
MWWRLLQKRIWWRLLQERVVRTQFDIYVVLLLSLIASLFNDFDKIFNDCDSFQLFRFFLIECIPWITFIMYAHNQNSWKPKQLRGFGNKKKDKWHK